jgi:hypothetical protein
MFRSGFWAQKNSREDLPGWTGATAFVAVLIENANASCVRLRDEHYPSILWKTM